MFDRITGLSKTGRGIICLDKHVLATHYVVLTFCFVGAFLGATDTSGAGFVFLTFYWCWPLAPFWASEPNLTNAEEVQEAIKGLKARHRALTAYRTGPWSIFHCGRSPSSLLFSMQSIPPSISQQRGSSRAWSPSWSRGRTQLYPRAACFSCLV